MELKVLKLRVFNVHRSWIESNIDYNDKKNKNNRIILAYEPN